VTPVVNEETLVETIAGGKALEHSASRLAGAARVENWLLRHTHLFSIVFVLTGFLIRIAVARNAPLNGDEALNFQLANQPRLLDVYSASLTNAHPPLFFFLLRFWLLLGNSELFLRFLPAIFGTVFLWVFYRWASGLFGGLAGFIALILLSFSPSLVTLSAQVRGYTLLLLLIAATLLVLEKAIYGRSAGWMAISAALLCLAMLTHYSAFFVVLALFVYAPIRLRNGRSPARLVKAWVGSQFAVIGILVFLGVTHVAGLRGGALEHEVISRMLRTEYFQIDQDRALQFLTRQTAAVFRALCGSSARGLVAAVLAAAGVTFLLRKREPSALLILLPFLLNAGAALIDVYPYGGARQSAYLLVFASTAVGSALAVLASGRRWAQVLAVGILATSTVAMAVSDLPGRDAVRMPAAFDSLRIAAPPGSLLFVDDRAFIVLDYYLGRNSWSTRRPGLQRFWESSVGGYRVIGSWIWNFTGHQLGAELQRLAEVYRLPSHQVVWLINVESEIDPVPEVSRRFPEATFPVLRRFGDTSLIKVVLP